MIDLPTRKKYLKLFQRHRGSQAALERSLGISHTALWSWFRGHSNSARIEQAVVERAGEMGVHSKPGAPIAAVRGAAPRGGR